MKNVAFQHKNLAYSVKDLARIVGISERKIHDEIKSGRLRISRVGRRVLIPANEVDLWLSSDSQESDID